jgi:mRNA interferase RelE/StbE
VSEAPKTYRAEIEPRPAQFLRKLASGDRASAKRISDTIRALATEPRPRGVVPVQTRPGFLRVRAGDYRIVYSVEDVVLKVTVVQIGHRSDVYQ